MSIELAEWQKVDGVDLTAEQVNRLAAARRWKFRPSGGGRWSLQAQHHVGVLHAPDLEISDSPKVSVPRLLELLCETIERVEWSETDALWAETDDLLATVAASLCVQIEDLSTVGCSRATG